MTMKQISALSDEELVELAKQKDRCGRCTADANKASSILRERRGAWAGVPKRPAGRGFVPLSDEEGEV